MNNKYWFKHIFAFDNQQILKFLWLYIRCPYYFKHYTVTHCRVFFAIAFTGMTIGQASSFLPDYSKAQHAAGILFKVLETIPGIDIYSSKGTYMVCLYMPRIFGNNTLFLHIYKYFYVKWLRFQTVFRDFEITRKIWYQTSHSFYNKLN